MSARQDGARLAARAPAARAAPAVFALPSFDEVYEANVDFLWRAARGMGVDESAVDDVLQDVFVVVHRRLSEFEGRATIRTWLMRILVHVVSEHRRRYRRKQRAHDPLDEETLEVRQSTPESETARSEAVLLLESILASMQEDQRIVFVLAEIEEIPVPEIAAALEVNVNTVYSRLRLARREYQRQIARIRARDEWRQR